MKHNEHTPSFMTWERWKEMPPDPSDAYIEGGWSGFSGGAALTAAILVHSWPLKIAAAAYWAWLFYSHCNRQSELYAQYKKSLEYIGRSILDAEKDGGRE